MADFGGNAGETGVANSGSPVFAPFEAWAEWPMSNIIPINWMEISKALQTLHQRQMSDPQRTMQVVTEYNRRLFETTMKVWSDTASRFSGLPCQEVVEAEGTSLANGARNLASDLEAGRLSMVDSNAFEVGENLATTPGKVVYRNELIELIQYESQTERVHEVPILFLPPWINKYYILDLSEKNSLVKYLVEQGFTVFMISWKNPDSSMEETKFEDYMTLGPLKTVDVIREITGSENVNPVGYCIGGTLLVMTLAWLAAGDDEKEKQKFGDPTFMVSLQDYSEVGDTEVFMDEPQFEAMEMQMMKRGYLDDRKMANMFNLLRSSDLIWANVINTYLLGQKPPALDMLYWNSDGTRMPRDAHSFCIRNTYLENNLIKPGEVEFMGCPIDLGRITGDIYAVGAEKDHIVPWKSAWKIDLPRRL